MITKDQYEYALSRIEELLPFVDGQDPNSREALELSIVSDIVIEYETEHYPIEKPTLSELIMLGLEEKHLTQKSLAEIIGVSPSRISDYVSGKSEPSLKVAGKLCVALGISPGAILGI